MEDIRSDVVNIDKNADFSCGKFVFFSLFS